MVILKETYQSIKKHVGETSPSNFKTFHSYHPVIQGVIKTLLMTRSWSGRQVGIGS